MVRIHKCSKQEESCAIVITLKTFEYFEYEIYSGLKIFSEQIYIAYYFALCFEDSNVAIIGSESLYYAENYDSYYSTDTTQELVLSSDIINILKEIKNETS